jgi:hypothetical protein
VVSFDWTAILSRGTKAGAGAGPAARPVRESKLAETRGATLFAMDPTWVPGRTLYLVAAVGKRLLVYKWQTATKTFVRFRVRPAHLAKAATAPTRM